LVSTSPSSTSCWRIIKKPEDIIGENGLLKQLTQALPEGAMQVRIPTKKIAHSELKTIRASPSDAGKSIVRQVIVMSQEKGS
jgi:hypothetical protein